MLFSEREKYKLPKDKIVLENITLEIRTGIWNYLYGVIFTNPHFIGLEGYTFRREENVRIQGVVWRLWEEYFKEPLDTAPDLLMSLVPILKKHIFEAPWYAPYDFLEFCLKNFFDEPTEAIEYANQVLERESSGYRIIEGVIAPITNFVEKKSIEEAISGPEKGVAVHLKRALELLSDKKSPDYRNSIKESISAIESICNVITESDKSTLTEALKVIERKSKFHPALKLALEKLYGFTSDAKGIRHFLLDESTASFAEAYFFLVSASAFINYLRQIDVSHGT